MSEKHPWEQATQQKIEARERALFTRYAELRYKMNVHRFGSFYTRIWNGLGNSTVYNTDFAANQLVFAVSRSEHPAVAEFIKNPKACPDNFDPAFLCEAMVLAGMKVLDLGCGYEPTFARSARRLGAEVYTVDVIPAKEFELWHPATTRPEDLESLKKYDPDKYAAALVLGREYDATRALETEKHIEIDLRQPEAFPNIQQRTGGEFDLITSAHLETGTPYQGVDYYPPRGYRAQARNLLKHGGVYFDPQPWDFMNKNVEVKL